MKIYDFDNTIFRGDSTRRFIFYCIRKYPRVLCNLPLTIWAFFLYVTGIYKKTRFKEKMYAFLKYLPDTETAVNDFWDKNIWRIRPWYRTLQRDEDQIISASPEFLLIPVCKMLGVRKPIASKVDPHTGKYDGLNCYGEEKVRRLKQEIPFPQVEEFYSDSRSDEPLAEMATRAYMVKKNDLIPWDEYEASKGEKLKKMFFSTEFLMFIIVGGVNTLNGILISWLCSGFIKNSVLAYIVGYMISNVIAYLLNSFFTFKEKLSPLKYVKFFVSYIPNFIIQVFVVYVFSRLLDFPSIASYAIAALIGVPVTFLFMKIFAFAGKKDKH